MRTGISLILWAGVAYFGVLLMQSADAQMIETKMHVIHDPAAVSQVYRALSLPEHETARGMQKSFVTSDKIVGLYCRQDDVCTIAVSLENRFPNLGYLQGKGVIGKIKRDEDARKLDAALNVPAQDSSSFRFKDLKLSDGTEIFCGRHRTRWGFGELECSVVIPAN